MGLLDDAIREHLELKRRRGADPDEVSRQVGEALGDPRRGEFAQPDAEPQEPAAVAAPEAAPPEAEPEPEPPAPPADEEPAPAEPEPEPEPWLQEEPMPAQPTAESAPSEPEPEATPPGDEARSDEDVLEETPDFLQETPEHDRLWFEQKPPRDFDFDN